MKPQFKHHALTSFFMWYDYTLMKRAEAFVTKQDLILYKQDDNRLPSSMQSYASEFKSWVADKSLCPTSENSIVEDENGVVIPRGDYSIDYDNGRIIMKTPAVFEKLFISEATIKECNCYVTNSSEEDLIVEKQSDVNENSPSSYPQNKREPIKPYDDAIPASFLSIETAVNNPYSMGGEARDSLYPA